MDKELAPWITKYLVDLSNYEEDDVELFFFSMNEESLTIQSSFFFLSKIIGHVIMTDSECEFAII